MSKSGQSIANRKIEKSKNPPVRAVVVLSGGQDSATCLALAVKKYGAENVAAITFAYGQRHAIETKFAKRLAKRFGIVEHKVVRFGFYRDLTTNALLDPTMKIGRSPSPEVGQLKLEVEVEERNCPSCASLTKRTARKSPDSTLQLQLSTSTLSRRPPNTVVEGRNAFFLMAAAVWAKSLGATVLYTGVSQADYSGYPDCRAVFIRAQEKAIRLALDYPIRIETPFMNMTKADEWALAAKLGIFDVIANETVTCYNGVPGKGCGKCPACKLRARGLREYMKGRSRGA